MVLKAESKEAKDFVKDFKMVTGNEVDSYFTGLDLTGFRDTLNQYPNLLKQFYIIPEVKAELVKRASSGGSKK